MKIKLSYTSVEEPEARHIVELLKPILDRFKVKKSEGTPPFLHLYFTSKKREKP